jgi:hypothetical protein
MRFDIKKFCPRFSFEDLRKAHDIALQNGAHFNWLEEKTSKQNWSSEVASLIPPTSRYDRQDPWNRFYCRQRGEFLRSRAYFR